MLAPSSGNPVYLDYNASAPLYAGAFDMASEVANYTGNPSSVHKNGRVLRCFMEDARQKMGDLLAVDAKNIIFTSGATEANNLALKNFKGTVLTSAIEHDSIFHVRPDAVVIRVLETGILDINHLTHLLDSMNSGPILVSVMAVNNETGVIQPVEQIAEICAHYKVLFHCDAVQAFGRVPLPWHKFHAVSLSGHKVGGLWGAGCLVASNDFPMTPLFVGGGQERSHRSGTENVTGIVSMAYAMEKAIQEDWQAAEKLRDNMEQALLEKMNTIKIFGHNQPRVCNTSSIYMPNVKSETQVMAFDLAGISISSGAACSSGKVKPSRILKAMGASDNEAQNTIRVSLCPTTSQKEIDLFLETWFSIFDKINRGNHGPTH